LQLLCNCITLFEEIAINISMVSKSTARQETGRTNDPARTVAEILIVATQEFAEKGLAGARIDKIAEATRTSKRMIYYYFKSKDGLYQAVLEHAYRRMRDEEAQLKLEAMEPVAAIKRLVEFTYEHHRDNEDYIRLVMNENIMKGEYLGQINSIKSLNQPAIESLRRVYKQGVKSGVFRAGLDAVDIHAAISALAFFNVSNRYTFGAIFDRKVDSNRAQTVSRDQMVELILRFVSLPKTN
jgi:AcrR family transcriptional regulator